MVKKSTWCLAAAVVLWGVSLRAQTVTPDDEDYDGDDPVQVAAHAAAADRASVLRHNDRQLEYALSVDRNTPYFPGEAMKIEIRITNPTSSPLEIPDPNSPAVQCFPGHVEEWCRVPLNVPTMTIQPGQVITLTFDGEDQEAAERWGFGGAASGRQRLKYLLGGSVEFEVGEPVLEASVFVPLQVFKTYQERGMKEPETIQYAAMVVAARVGDEHVLLIGQKNTLATRAVAVGKDGTLLPRTISWGAPWIRLATFPTAITSLKGTADAKGRITLQYTGADSIEQTLYLNEQRHPGR